MRIMFLVLLSSLIMSDVCAYDLRNIIKITGAAMQAQSSRLKVISENIANTDTVAQTPGGEPYRRQIIFFHNIYDSDIDASILQVAKVGYDYSDFKQKYEPYHPAANEEGYVRYPNVTSVIESGDAQEAKHSYEANIRSMEITKSMIRETINILN